MKYIFNFSIFLFFIVGSISAQTAYKVSYEEEVYSTTNNTALWILDTITLYQNNEKHPSSPTTSFNQRTVYKDYVKGVMYSGQDIVTGDLEIVLDTLDLLSWEIGNKSKPILGLQCFEASTDFRGRKYTAYFTPEIPISEGPWKFGGLPGLILEVKSNDSFISFVATRIEYNVSADFDAAILHDVRPMAWDDFSTFFIEKWDQIIEYVKAESDLVNGKSFIKKEMIEVIYPELQLGGGYGIHTTE